MKERDVSKIDCIVVHHSQSEYGDFNTIDRWHKDRGFDMCGYHSIILNCYPDYDAFVRQTPDINSDGKEEEGRKPEVIGAGVRGHNQNTIHICLIGDRTFTSAQLITLRSVVEYYKGLIPTINKVVRHCDLDEKKPGCPGLSRKFLKDLLA